MKFEVTVALALVASTAPAFAQPTPKFEFSKAEEVKDVKGTEWAATAEGGIVFVTGNAETTTLTGGFKASRKTGKNKLTIEGGLTYAESSLRAHVDQPDAMGNAPNGLVDSNAEIQSVSSVTSENFASKLRYDRYLTSSNSLFGAGLASRDVPAGKTAVFGGQLGYSRRIHKTKTAEAFAELGYDFSHEELAAGSSLSIHSARAFLGYKGEMTEGTTLDASVEALTNLLNVDLPTKKDGRIGRDTRLNNRVAISSKIGKNLAIQTSIEVKFDNRPAPLVIPNLAPGFVPESAKIDTQMKASLIYTIF